MASEHGGLNYRSLREQGIDPDGVCDFSVSVNPDPLPPGMLEAIRESRVTRYPDSYSSLLRETIAERYGVDEDSLLVVNGTSQGMYLLVSALLKEGDPVGIVEPTYGEYRDACLLKTENIRSLRMKKEEDFAFDIPGICAYLKGQRPVQLWLCSPNNPTGCYLKEDEFEILRRCCLETDTLLILDEAYACFLPEERRYPVLKEGVLILRSMTKDFSIPGLRLGYLMGETEIIRRIARWQPEWSLSAPAQDAGIAGFRDFDLFHKSWMRTIRRRESFRRELASLGLRVYESSANFFLAEVDDVEALKAHLWRSLILVRDCRSFGLENTIRLGVRSTKDNRRLTACIKEYLER